MKQRQHSSDTLFSFLLLLIFTVFTLLLAGTGAVVYKNSMAKLDENYTSRTAIAYVSEKLRQHDSSGDVELTVLPENTSAEAFSDNDASGKIPALVLHDTVGGEPFLTYIYYYDGALRELFVREATEVFAGMGNRIVELASFTVEYAGNDTENGGEGVSSGNNDKLSCSNDGDSSYNGDGDSSYSGDGDSSYSGDGDSSYSGDGDSSYSDDNNLSDRGVLRVTAVSPNGNELSILIHLSAT